VLQCFVHWNARYRGWTGLARRRVCRWRSNLRPPPSTNTHAVYKDILQGAGVMEVALQSLMDASLLADLALVQVGTVAKPRVRTWVVASCLACTSHGGKSDRVPG